MLPTTIINNDLPARVVMHSVKPKYFPPVLLSLLLCSDCRHAQEAGKKAELPNIILIMTDDQGWGQTGYYSHPVLETPNLDEMASNGIRLDRFYAAAPLCSPTRASVLTGRTSDRSGVFSHGYSLRKQEKTISKALRDIGYATGHFGKWHLNGLMGPGVPIFADDPHSPGAFGFEEWVSVTNFFDVDPLMSDNGEFIEFKGTTSEIIVDLALRFIDKNVQEGKPFFAAIWDGSPHAPFRALEKDKEGFEELDENSANHYGELVAFDRSVGTLRQGLRELGIAGNTLIWFCSDNGGLGNIDPTTAGHLRGFKGSLYEGGIRVPAIVEWPGRIEPSVSNYPASTMDIFPTIADIVSLPDSVMTCPRDGQSIRPVLTGNRLERDKPIPFRFQKSGALIDNGFKLYTGDRTTDAFELFNLSEDPGETVDVSSEYPGKYAEMKEIFNEFNHSVEKSIQGLDYPAKEILDSSRRRVWMTDPRYEPYLDEWVKKWEYGHRIRKAIKSAGTAMLVPFIMRSTLENTSGNTVGLPSWYHVLPEKAIAQSWEECQDILQ